MASLWRLRRQLKVSHVDTTTLFRLSSNRLMKIDFIKFVIVFIVLKNDRHVEAGLRYPGRTAFRYLASHHSPLCSTKSSLMSIGVRLSAQNCDIQSK